MKPERIAELRKLCAPGGPPCAVMVLYQDGEMVRLSEPELADLLAAAERESVQAAEIARLQRRLDQADDELEHWPDEVAACLKGSPAGYDVEQDALDNVRRTTKRAIELDAEIAGLRKLAGEAAESIINGHDVNYYNKHGQFLSARLRAASKGGEP